ncbi:MAG: hypothetical protein ILP17_00170 [Lachnospiraceae bacterium]|nr:hypothetical protein [Lachnospiraceae bacterium]MBP1584096.1 hypothetical protein [Lachnospiraceae bacterium]
MIVTKPADFRMNQKDFFQKAFEGEPVIISRPRNENVIILSVDEYNSLKMYQRISAYYDGISELCSKAEEMDKHDNISDEELINFYKSFLQLIRDKKNQLFRPLSKEEMLVRLNESRKNAEDGKYKPASQIYEEMRALYGL